MASDGLNEQIWKLYDTLPRELKDAFFSEEIGRTIATICEENDLDEEMATVVECVGDVLLGIVPVNEFGQKLEEKLEIEPEIIKTVVREINRLVFYPLRESLATLSSPEATAGLSALTHQASSPPGSEAKARKRPDTYREPIE